MAPGGMARRSALQAGSLAARRAAAAMRDARALCLAAADSWAMLADTMDAWVGQRLSAEDKELRRAVRYMRSVLDEGVTHETARRMCGSPGPRVVRGSRGGPRNESVSESEVARARLQAMDALRIVPAPSTDGVGPPVSPGLVVPAVQTGTCPGWAREALRAASRERQGGDELSAEYEEDPADAWREEALLVAMQPVRLGAMEGELEGAEAPAQASGAVELAMVSNRAGALSSALARAVARVQAGASDGSASGDGENGNGPATGTRTAAAGAAMDDSDGGRDSGELDGIVPAPMPAGGSLENDRREEPVELPPAARRTGVLARKAGRAILPPGTDLRASAAAAAAVGAPLPPRISPRLRAGLRRVGGDEALRRRAGQHQDEAEPALEARREADLAMVTAGRHHHHNGGGDSLSEQERVAGPRLCPPMGALEAPRDAVMPAQVLAAFARALSLGLVRAAREAAQWPPRELEWAAPRYWAQSEGRDVGGATGARPVRLSSFGSDSAFGGARGGSTSPDGSGVAGGLSSELGGGSSMEDGFSTSDIESRRSVGGGLEVHDDTKAPSPEAFAARALQLGLQQCARRGTFLRGGAGAWDSLGRVLAGSQGGASGS